MTVHSVQSPRKAFLIAALALFGAVSSKADSGATPHGEYALYNLSGGGGNSIAVTRAAGQVQLSWCRETYTPPKEKRAEPGAAMKFVREFCAPAPVTDLSYIAGKTDAVATIAQTWAHPANSAEGGELSSALSTYLIGTWPSAPVGNSDTVVYTGVKIVHDHSDLPRLSTVRLTFELVGVTRAE